MARPVLPIDPALVEHYAGLGMTLEQIAAACGVSYNTLARRRQVMGVMDAAIAAGKAKAQAKVGNALFDRATGGDVPAIKWYEQTRLGYKERSDVTTGDEKLGVVGYEYVAGGRPRDRHADAEDPPDAAPGTGPGMEE